jgi:propionyl-CoA carboxylase beta chain
MNSKHIGCDINFAWPAAEIAVLGPKGAAQIIYRKEIEEAGDPEEMLTRKTEEYRVMYANPFMAAKRGFIDDVISPRDTRHRLIRSLQFLESKRTDRPQRKHGNIPL